MSLRPAIRTLVIVLAMSTIAGCGGHYRPLSVDDVHFDGWPPQRPAVITLSDPQIYSRETLVNDRRREAKYLEGLIEDSEDEVFEPQIRRDLRELTATVLRLEAAADPLAGRQAARADDLAAIDQQIAEADRLTQLAEARARLIQAERELEELADQQEALAKSAGDDDDDDGDDGDDAGDDDGGGDDEEPEEEEQEEAAKQVEALRANVAAIKELIAALPSTQEVRQAATKATPREIFRDRQAYRGELRGALAEVELDDAHDQGQNSLYRLQFRATVMPGRHQDKMGVARLTLRPPELERSDVVELYKTWLGHVTYRLNQTLGSRFRHDMSYLLLGMSGIGRSLFHSTSLPLENGEEILIALPPSIYAKWKHVSQKSCPSPPPEGCGNDECCKACAGLDSDHDCPDLVAIRDKVREVKIFVRKVEEECPPGVDTCCLCGSEKWEEHRRLLNALGEIEPFMSASIRGLGDVGSLDPVRATLVNELLMEIVNAGDTLDRLHHRDQACQEMRTQSTCIQSMRAPASKDESIRHQLEEVPKVFREALVRPCDDRKALCGIPQDAESLGIARGGADVYATAPVELAQQISTTASAVRSFELALALAASLPTSGVDADVGLNRLRATRTDLEARERLPLIVGFAERRPWWAVGNAANGDGVTKRVYRAEDLARPPKVDSQDWPDGEDPQFGWIFGPQATIDAGRTRLRLRQPVVNHPVTADLSIPGWWPRVHLTLETAWIANWHGGDVLDELTDGDTRFRDTFPVYLPINRADLDGLTEYLARHAAGGALPYTSIAAVSPETISTCADEVTFLVYGANVWRSTEAFLNGLEASEIRVLPDMAGLAVTFEDIRKNLPQVPGKGGEAVLTVWTRNGASSAPVTVVDPKTAGLSCGPAKPPGLKLAVAERALVSRAIAGSTDRRSAEVKLRVVEGKPPRTFARLAPSVRPASPRSEGVPHRWSPIPGDPEENAKLDGKVLAGKALLPADLDDGTVLEASLVEVPAPRAEEKRHAVEGKLVHYLSAASATIQVRTSSLADDSMPIVLQFPARYDVAYPDLRAGKVTFRLSASPPGSLNVVFKEPGPKTLPPADGDDAARRRPFAFEIQTKDGEKPADADRESFLATERKLTVTIHGGDDLPAVTGEVTLGEEEEDDD